MNDRFAVYEGEARQVVPALGMFDLVVTDPPYAMDSNRKEWRATAGVALGLGAAARSVRKGGTMAVFCASSGRSVNYTVGAIGSVLPLARVLVWHKKFVRCRAAGPWPWNAVLVLLFGRGSWGRMDWSMSAVHTTTGIASSKAYGVAGHPAALPVSVCDWIVGPFGGDKRVLDPFCGTAALLIPALRNGCEVVGVEKDATWAALARDRLATTEAGRADTAGLPMFAERA
ncbi:MAG: hypothetical protein QME96_06250 [Myxococcota bacterium]|nr:hypothetical protein [Myxococcota bacterium]